MKIGRRSRLSLLRPGALLRIEAEPGRRIACVRGIVWVTVQGRSEDRMLWPGEALVFDRTGIVLAGSAGPDAALAHEDTLAVAYCRPFPNAASAAGIGRAIDAAAAGVPLRIGPGMDASAHRAAVEAHARLLRARIARLLFARSAAAVATALRRVAARAASLLRREAPSARTAQR